MRRVDSRQDKGKPYDPVDMFWSDMDFEGATKHFVTPGNDLTSLLMRSGIPDQRVAVAVVTFIARCQICHDKKHLDMVRNWIAAQCSLRGQSEGARIHTLLQAVVGQLDGHRPRASAPWKKKEKVEEQSGD